MTYHGRTLLLDLVFHFQFQPDLNHPELHEGPQTMTRSCSYRMELAGHPLDSTITLVPEFYKLRFFLAG